MIDVSKIKVGDEVTVRHVVRRVDDNDKSLPIFIDAKSWVAREEIATHTPKPREFKPGDRVAWIGNEGSRWRIKAIDDGEVWLRWDGYTGLRRDDNDPAHKLRMTQKITSIRHADESE